jgi:fructosamine-3-kinase
MQVEATVGNQDLDRQTIEFLEEAGLVSDGPIMAQPLTGGVASDIWKVQSGERVFVVKKALSRLRVAQEWNAPISRNASEVQWMIEAAKVVPAAVPEILAHDALRGVFAMSYLDPRDHPVWKTELHDGRADPAFAAMLGHSTAAIHSATARSNDVAARFSNDDIFQSIRLEPYLDATARIHADLAGALLALSRDTLSSKRALVHGDISPKNILVGPEGPVILDAECAWYGEPAFDLAFCLNHLLLKCLWVPGSTDAFLDCFDALAAAYLKHVDWEKPSDLERRAARLLPALLLARVDGKSPVEYLTKEEEKAHVRRVGRELVASVPATLAQVRQRWAKEILK